MFVSHLIAEAHKITFEGDEQCCVCGAGAAKARKDSLKATFTNTDALLYPNSDFICNACAFCLSPLTRRTSFISTEKFFTPFKRNELSKVLFSPPRIPFVFCVTTSFKKYLWIYAKVNTNPNCFHIRFDDMDVWCEPNKHRRIFQAIEILYQNFSKGEIQRGNYRVINLEKLDDWSSFERMEYEIKPWRGSAIFELCLYAANLSKENQKRWKKKKEQKNPVSPTSNEQLNLC